MKDNGLGDFLRARRQQVRPEDVGLVPGARRRVARLRREELAMLAGGDHVLMYRAKSGSDSARAIEKLRSLSAASTTGSGGE